MFKLDMQAIRTAAVEATTPTDAAANDEKIAVAELAKLAAVAVSSPSATEWLTDFLAEHIVPATAVRIGAARAGIPWYEVQQAADDLLVRVMTSDGKKYWAMPQRRLGPWVH